MFFLRLTGMNIPVPPLLVRNALPIAGLKGAAMRVEKFRSVPMSAEFGLISRETTQKGYVAPQPSREVAVDRR